MSGVDISAPALEVAQKNADSLGAKVKIFRSDLLESIESLPDIITANLPYVDMGWDWTSPELKFEPALAFICWRWWLKTNKEINRRNSR